MTNDQDARTGALEIVRRLQARGFRALWAGGCVRDMLMGQVPRDYDIATNADLQQVIGIFPHAQVVGAHFGVVIVRLGDYHYEVARFRRDLGYSDGRRPDGVVFVDEEEDARRRDFTINGMFFDPVGNVVLDYVGGQVDLKEKVIRTIGDPHARFCEDRLRMLRAIRFGCRYHWPLEEKTREAIGELSGSIEFISFERIRDEVGKILTEGGAPLGVRWLIDLGLMAVFMPEVVAMDGVPQPPQFHPEGDVLTHTLIMLGLMQNPSVELAMGILLHDVGKPPTYEVRDRIRFHNHTKVGREMAEEICRRLRFSSEKIKHIAALVADHHKFMHVQEMRSSTLKRFLRTDRFEDHLELHRIDCLSSHGALDNYEFCKVALENLEPEQIRPVPLINGRDLIAMGQKPGPAFKQVLRAVEDAQLEGRVTHRDEAMRLAAQVFESLGL
ncbi:MAG: CCA tRNA nucleotidyltransferase [Gemmatimonadetes bacterium]|nr:CCA tRNA nucleotidyltransferase [Gemmatimonadota bacterium]